jgi:hypothetical protein
MTNLDPSWSAMIYILKFRDQTLAGEALRPTREPVRDVDVGMDSGWRRITASKWMPSNIAYWIERDLGFPVVNEARVIGDFDFDLRWRVGDIASANAALATYGMELVESQRDTDSA